VMHHIEIEAVGIFAPHSVIELLVEIALSAHLSVRSHVICRKPLLPFPDNTNPCLR
jgi:hypothetical protein